MKKYENLCRTLANLHLGAQLQEPYTVVEETGIVALFELCFEASWRVMKELLEEDGRCGRSDKGLDRPGRSLRSPISAE